MTATTMTKTREEMLPAPSGGLTPLDAPVTTVMLLEDRAQVQRVGRLALVAGLNRLTVRDVAPVIQDVSLRGEVRSGTGRVVDARLRRAMRVRREHLPEEARQLEEQIRSSHTRFLESLSDREHAHGRYSRLQHVLALAAGEIPVDAAWGQVNPQLWHDGLEALFKRSRALRESVLRLGFTAEELAEEIKALAERRRLLDSPDTRFVAWVELDVFSEAGGDVEIALDYVVPNALWRPMHTARLDASRRVSFAGSAAVWQNTGEDWADVELAFSTARSSLGTDPPLLSDDLLAARKKSEEVIVQARQVQVQSASVKGGGAAGAPQRPSSVELPGVDDGGEVRQLKARGRITVRSDGRPHLIPLFEFESPAELSLVAFPELDEKAFLRSVQPNTSNVPILAGPVELLRDNGSVGWTRTLFVAQQERFQLSFGPDDAIRIVRKAAEESAVDQVSKWTVTKHRVKLFVSNVGGEPRALTLTERIPVSEIEQVKVELLSADTTQSPLVDDDGFVTWKIEVPGNGQAKIGLGWQLSIAPGVTEKI